MNTPPLWNNPAAAWWTPRRFSALLAVVFVLGILGVLNGLLWQHDAVSAGWAGGVLFGDLLMVGACANKQGWRWFLKPDNSTTRWQNH